MSAVMTHHRAQLLAPEKTTAAARGRDSMTRGDQNNAQDAVSWYSSRRAAFESPKFWTDILLAAVIAARRAAEIAASASVLITPPNSP